MYRVHDTKLQCDVALKLMRCDGRQRDQSSRSVLEEARRSARVRHANVVTVYGADQIDGRVGLWMELVRGTNLEQQLQRQGTISGRARRRSSVSTCGRAVAAVHRAGLLHGDIKAHNVMREEGGRTVLMDFGAGKISIRTCCRCTSGDRRDFAGTPLYVAPEVFAGSRRTKAADVTASAYCCSISSRTGIRLKDQTRGDRGGPSPADPHPSHATSGRIFPTNSSASTSARSTPTRGSAS